MKRAIKYLLLFAVIFIICDILSNQAYGMYQTSIYDWNLEYYLKTCFLYVDNTVMEFTSLNTSFALLYFSILLLSIYFLQISFYVFSQKYRSMIIQRYFKRIEFIRFYKIKALRNTSVTTLWIAVCILVCGMLKSKLHIDTNVIMIFVVQILNLFVYLNIIVLVNLYLSLKHNETIALLAVMFGTSIILMVDVYLKMISILTFGSISTLCLGLILQIIIYFITNLYINLKIKTMDLL